MRKKEISIILFALFSGCIFFLAFNKHSKSGIFTYHSVIWSDKAGYYIYLPAVFKYHLHPEDFPDSIENKTGQGFHLDLINNKIITKYTYGIALLQLPFFFTADMLAKPMNFENNGFSLIYDWAINIASVFYLLMGLILLRRFLLFFTRQNVVLTAILSIFLGTNLYYYSIDETGMSHVYSFFLFSYFLYLIKKTNYLVGQNFWKYFEFGIVTSLIVIIRPSNIVFISTFFFLDIDSWSGLILRIKTFFRYKALIPFILGAIILLLPQIAYWKYAFGSIIYYTYGHESFNWINPKIQLVFFSPSNGLFLYCPFVFIIVTSMIYMVKKRIISGIFFLWLFLVISYVFSSWWDCGFGCAFGARSYVEYMAIFSIPVVYLYNHIITLKPLKIILFTCLVIALIIFNLKMTYSYDGCFYGGTWDWHAYIKLVTSPTK